MEARKQMITSTTRVVAIFGYPVTHSLSPLMQNAAFAHLGLDYCYVACTVKPELLGDAVKAVRALGMRGANVTVPHKEGVIRMLDEVTGEALEIGAVNTIVNEDGRLVGHNTDGRGFREALIEDAVDVDGKMVLMIGAGGAARAVGHYLSHVAPALFIYNRTLSAADMLAGRLAGQGAHVEVVNEGRMGSRDFVAGIDIIVNTTTLGLRDDDPLPVNPSFLGGGQVVCDLIYRETPLLRAASRRGCKTLDGSGMLLWQGALAFELWTGVKAPVAEMRRALTAGRKSMK
jgi:shikimate dehydrogenase